MNRPEISERLEESLRLFRFAIDQAGDAIFFVRPDGQLFDVNETACRRLGFAREQLLAMHIWDVDADYLQPYWKTHWRELTARGSLIFETRHRRNDRSLVPVEVVVQYLRHGEREFACGFARDITERRRADWARLQQLRAVKEERKRADELLQASHVSELLMGAIVEHLPDMIFVKDAKTLRFVLLNRAAEELLGWSRSSLLGKTDHDFFPEREARFFEENDRAVLSSGTLRDIAEEPIHTRNGERVLHTKKVPIIGDDGNPLYLVGISSDITEQTRAERDRALLAEQLELLIKQLENAVTARNDILAMVSHDLKNWVGTILLSITLLERDDLAGTDASLFRSTIDGIRRAAKQMNRLIETLLDAAAIESGHFSVVPEPRQVDALVDEALELMRPAASESGHPLERGTAEFACSVCCDRQRILQVFSNLIGNAIKFTPPGGSINVSAQREGDAVRFAVVDRGPGIPEEALPHLFERYWKAKPVSLAGSGLGLYIVQGVVQAHGGKVWVESRPGAGSSFFFTLPVAKG